MEMPSKASQLDALRAIHKLEKQKRMDSAAGERSGKTPSPPKGSQPSRIGSRQVSGSNQSVRLGSSEQVRDSERSPPRQVAPAASSQKRDISITLSAYNAQLKRAEDKEFFKQREEFSQALIKLEALDTRDLVVAAD
jgi:hypothetical protein